MNFKRDREKNFTREELMAIEAEATTEGIELVDQMAGVMLAGEGVFERVQEERKMLLDAAKMFLAIDGPVKEGTMHGRLHKHFKDVVEGMDGGGEEPGLVSMTAKGTGVELRFRTHWASKLIATSIAKTLKKDDGTYWNNITYELHDPLSRETYYVEVQRKSGKTTKQQLNEAEARIKELEGVANKHSHQHGCCCHSGCGRCDCIMSVITKETP